MKLYLLGLLFLSQTLCLFASVGAVTKFEGQPYALRKLQKISLIKGSVLEENDNIYTKNGSLSLVMEDGSAIDLGPESHFKVKAYHTDGQQTDRDVLLYKGTSRFNVKPILSTKEESFSIRTPSAVVGVRGTDFNVGVDDSETTTVTVFNGIVACYSIFGESQSPAMILHEGFQSKLATGRNPSAKIKVGPSEMKALKGATTGNDRKASTDKKEPVAPKENLDTVAPPERHPLIDSIIEDTQAKIKETISEELAPPSRSLFDQITPTLPPVSEE